MKRQSVSYRFGQVVWCKFSGDDCAIAPEFIGEHPAVIVSTKNRSGLPYLVVPMTSAPPKSDDPAILCLDPSPVSSRGKSYVVASHVYSVSQKRLRVAHSGPAIAHFPKERIGELIDAMNLRWPQKKPGQE